MLQGVVETQARGNVKNIAVSMEDRMGGRKHLTHLSHVESFGLDPDELATVLQRKWSTSCSISRLPGKTETGKMLDLQGNLLKVLCCHTLHLAVATSSFTHCLGCSILSHVHVTSLASDGSMGCMQLLSTASSDAIRDFTSAAPGEAIHVWWADQMLLLSKHG